MKDDIEKMSGYWLLPPIVFPKLSDESAYEISEYLQDVAQAFDGYYFSQIRRYIREREKPEEPAEKIYCSSNNEDPF